MWSRLFNSKCGYLMEHGRPVYNLHEIDDFSYINASAVAVTDNDVVNIIYSGSRWMIATLPGGKLMNGTAIENRASEYHAFWDA